MIDWQPVRRRPWLRLAVAALSGALVAALVASCPVFSLVLLIAVLWVTSCSAPTGG